MIRKILQLLTPKAPEPESNVGTFNKTTHRIVPRNSSVYDPSVFGKYDIENQKIVAKNEMDHNFSLDTIVPLAQRHRSAGGYTLNCNRIDLSYSFIPPGDGVLLDACSPSVNEKTKAVAESLGYSYLPIDINGDGENVRKEDLCELSLESESVSVVFSVDTLEHIQDLDAALGEIFRVLKESGTVVVHVPAYFFSRTDSPDIAVENDPYGHVRYFSGPDLAKQMFNSGFIPMRVEFNLDYGAAIVCAVKNSNLWKVTPNAS